MKKTKERWINLSNKAFEDRRYFNPEGYNNYVSVKPKTGMWFSLENKHGSFTDWANFVNQEMPYIKDKYINSDGKTNVITASLKDTSYIVNLKLYKSQLIEVLNNLDKNATAEEIRKSFLEKMKYEIGDYFIEHLILLIEKDTFLTLRDVYDTQLKKDPLSSLEYKLKVRFNMLNSSFEEYKKRVEKRLELWEKLKDINTTYSQIKEYFDEDDESHMSLMSLFMPSQDEVFLRMLFEKKEIDEFNLTDSNAIETYKQIISEANSLEEYNVLLSEKCKIIPILNPQTELIADCFSGCINYEIFDSYDIPSLAVFDTDCIEVLSQRKENIFGEQELDDYEEYNINKTNMGFLRKNGFDIKDMRQDLDCKLYSTKDINEIINEFKESFVIPSKETNVCIGDIIGMEGLHEKDIFEHLDEFFDEDGKPYKRRALELLDLTSENILEKLKDSFFYDPIVCKNIGENNKHIITTNGMHRFMILKIWYLKEIYEAQNNEEQIQEINEKYTIPAKIYENDLRRIYYAYLIKMAGANKYYNYAITNIEKKDDLNIVTFYRGLNSFREFLSGEEFEKINKNICSISSGYDDNSNSTKDIQLLYFDNSIKVLNPEEFELFTKELVSNSENKDEMSKKIQELYNRYSSFKEFIDAENLKELFGIGDIDYPSI